jgi:SpoVK/Ycf46/Vps4 family AAA+-type ATPase
MFSAAWPEWRRARAGRGGFKLIDLRAVPGCVLLVRPDRMTMEAAGVRERVLSQLLGELDGLQPRSQVVVLAATNRPHALDAALLRPGRFDRLIYVPVPDLAARLSILNVHLLRLRVDPAGVDATGLAARTPGFTGADIGALCREAAMCALDEGEGAALRVTAAHFEAALRLCAASPPVDEATMAAYLKMQRGSHLLR